TAQHVYKQTVVLRKHIKDVGRFDCLASTRARTFERTLKKISRVGSNAHAFADVLPRGVQPVLDRARHVDRIQGETAHGRIKEIGFFLRESADYMFDRDVVLIATPRLVQGVLEYPLTAITELVFVCF